MIITYDFMFAAVALGTASNIFAKEAEGFTKIFPSPPYENQCDCEQRLPRCRLPIRMKPP